MAQENKDIQPQAEPHIVKSHDIHIDADYADWTADFKSRYLFYAEKIKKTKTTCFSKWSGENAPSWCRIDKSKTPTICWRITVRY